MTELDAAVERVWPGRNLRYEVLGGGITNRNALVVVDGDAVVLRIAGKDTALLGIDRRVELEATRAAATLGIGPEVVDFVEPEGWLVTRFVEGRTLSPEELRDPRGLERVALALRRFHESAPIAGAFDSFRVVEAYRDTTLARGGRVPPEFGRAHAIAARIEDALAGARAAPCHNDLLSANFLVDGERLVIVDWEYAGMGDAFFDLANFAVNHELGPAERADFLAFYRSGTPSEEDARALELMRFMSDFREAMWGVVQTAVSELEFDFAVYAAEHFERLERIAAEPEFAGALG